MMDREKLIQELSKYMIGWDFSYIDAIEKSGGNTNRWKQSSYTLSNSWAFPTSLGVALFSMDTGKEIFVLDVYVPYFNRVECWDIVFNMECV
jgi:hypothetical protein